MPRKKIAAVRISRQSIVPLDEYIEKRIDPRNRAYYWQACNPQTSLENPEIDGAALGRNCISITPIKCDTTDYTTLETLKGWDINKL